MRFLLVLMFAFSVIGNSRVTHAQGPTILEIANAIHKHREGTEKEIVEDFIELLSLPNVATSLPDMQKNAEHIHKLLEPRGFEVRTLRSGGAPYVFAELVTPGAEKTILIYAHFD